MHFEIEEAELKKEESEKEQKKLEDAYKAADDAVKSQNEKIAGFKAAVKEKEIIREPEE